MCLAEISYYPNVPLAMCQQQGVPKDYLSMVGATESGGPMPWLDPMYAVKFTWFIVYCSAVYITKALHAQLACLK